jgi:hypothetical protein
LEEVENDEESKRYTSYFDSCIMNVNADKIEINLNPDTILL